MKNTDELTATTSAALLNAFGNALNQWSLLAALATILILGLLQNSIYSCAFLATSSIAALLQGYFAARCAFDAAVFAALGGEANHYEHFDNLLTRWQLRTATTTLRPLDERVQGAMRLLRWQAVSFFTQIGLLVVGLLIA